MSRQPPLGWEPVSPAPVGRRWTCGAAWSARAISRAQSLPRSVPSCARVQLYDAGEGGRGTRPAGEMRAARARCGPRGRVVRSAWGCVEARRSEWGSWGWSVVGRRRSRGGRCRAGRGASQPACPALSRPVPPYAALPSSGPLRHGRLAPSPASPARITPSGHPYNPGYDVLVPRTAHGKKAAVYGAKAYRFAKVPRTATRQGGRSRQGEGASLREGSAHGTRQGGRRWQRTQATIRRASTP